jgi:lipid-A-disaccharide synthase
MGRALRIGLVAGEISGDRLGAALMARLRERHPDISFEGVPGPQMRAAGCHAVGNAEQLAVMGIAEVVRHLPGLLSLRRKLVRHFVDSPPDLFLGIDAPDFNLGLERRLKRQGIRTLHWVSPSVWAWRQTRVRKIGQSVERMLTLLPFEADFYRAQGIAADYVGHPLADEISGDCNRQQARDQLHLDANEPCVALLPGSRVAEINRLLPVFLATAVKCKAAIPSLQFVLPVAERGQWPLIESYLERELLNDPGVRLVDDARIAMCAADLALLASGTATLECMLLKRPMVVAYRLHPLSYAVVKRLLRVPYVSLPNNLLQRLQVPEFLQSAANPAQLSEAVLRLLENPGESARQVQPFSEIHDQLRRGGADRVADIVLRACE